jgi:hypothetical protein
MLDRTRSLVAVRLVAGAAIVALAVAACGGSSSTPSPAGSAAAPTQAAPAVTPAPTAPPQEEPSESAGAGGGGGTSAGGCADMAAVSAALKNVDHYVATATIAVPLPGASAESGMGMDMVMKFQKPDSYEISTGIGGGVLFAMKKVGQDSWLQMFGADTWTKADPSTSSTESDPNFFANLQGEGLEPLAQIPAGLDLPGSSSCVVGYSVKAPAVTGSGDASDPLSTLSSATAVAVRVDTSTNLPQSMGVLIDTSVASAGTPSAIVFAFDYQTPVDIQPPDPSKVTEGGLGGFPFPSGMELPSGLTLP